MQKLDLEDIIETEGPVYNKDCTNFTLIGPFLRKKYRGVIQFIKMLCRKKAIIEAHPTPSFKVGIYKRQH